MRWRKVLWMQRVWFGVLMLAGCRAALGLDEYAVAAEGTAGASGAAPDSVVVVAGHADMDPSIHRAGQTIATARQGSELDAGTHVSAADGGGGRDSAARDAAVSHAADATDAAEAHPEGTEEIDDDAGAAADGGLDSVLGSTGLHVTDILGYYSGEWGQMLLRKHGDEIWGAYEYRDGTIIGRLDDEGVFAGWWTQVPTRLDENAGEVEFRWTKIGNTIALDGRWRYGSEGEWLENWDIIRVTDRSAPSQLTDRFDSVDDFKRHP